MKKLITILTAAALALSLAACSGNNAETSGSEQSSGSKTDSAHTSGSADDSGSGGNAEEKIPEPKEIEEAIAKALGDGYYCTADVPEEGIILSCLGRLDLTKTESYIVKQAAVAAVQQDTVAVVKCKSGYADEAVNQLNDYYAQTISYIRQYPFDVAKVEGARIYKVGDTVMYILAGASPESNASAEEEVKLANAEYEKIDEAVKSIFGTLPENLAVIPRE